MLNRLLPRQLDNSYRGSKLALWVFGFVILVKIMMSLNSIFNGRTVATSADGIPLETYPAAAAQAIVALFAIWALGQLVICLLCALALARYRAAVPFMFAVLLLEHLSRKLIFYFLPIATTGAALGAWVNVALPLLMIAGLALSLWTAALR